MTEQIQLPLEPEPSRAGHELDLRFLLQEPVFDAKALLTIEALAPLSMVTSMPGKYYRCQPEPTHEMLWGMLENALGWHICEKKRNALLQKMQKKLKAEARATGVGFKSLLQFHVCFTASVIPPLLNYDDYWAQHLKHTDERHIKGSRNYDYHAIPLLNKIKSGQMEMNDKELINFFPQYYISPTPRGYVMPKGKYQYGVETSKELSELIAAALLQPNAPLYLGSNDGWVDASWEELK
jgi:CRISPR-associated protein Cas5